VFIFFELRIGCDFFLKTGMKMTNKAGIPMAGKKLGAIPSKYARVIFWPL